MNESIGSIVPPSAINWVGTVGVIVGWQRQRSVNIVWVQVA